MSTQQLVYVKSFKGASFYDPFLKITVSGSKIQAVEKEKFETSRACKEALGQSRILLVSEKEYQEYQEVLKSNIEDQLTNSVISVVAKNEIEALAAKYGPKAIINYLASLSTNKTETLAKSATKYLTSSSNPENAALSEAQSNVAKETAPKKTEQPEKPTKIEEPEQPKQPSANVAAEELKRRQELEPMSKEQLLKELSQLESVSQAHIKNYQTKTKAEIIDFIIAWEQAD